MSKNKPKTFLHTKTCQLAMQLRILSILRYYASAFVSIKPGTHVVEQRSIYTHSYPWDKISIMIGFTPTRFISDRNSPCYPGPERSLYAVAKKEVCPSLEPKLSRPACKLVGVGPSAHGATQKKQIGHANYQPVSSD